MSLRGSVKRFATGARVAAQVPSKKTRDNVAYLYSAGPALFAIARARGTRAILLRFGAGRLFVARRPP
jgi:hypothetical protein